MTIDAHHPVHALLTSAAVLAPESDSQPDCGHIWGGLQDNPQAAVEFRHSGWARQRRLVFESLFRTGQSFSRKSQFKYCGSHAFILQSIENPDVYRIAGSSCHDRFCLPCGNERTKTIAMNVLEQTGNKTLRFLTLTLKSAQQDLDSLLNKLYASFSALRRRTFWRKRVTGGIAFLEVKWIEEKQRWHPHLHVLIEGRYLPLPQLRKLWYEITDDSYIVDIKLVRDRAGASAYVTKYACKPFNNTFINRPDRLDEAVTALMHRKLIVTFGTWRGVCLSRSPSDEAWQNIGSLEDMLVQAAHGDKEANAILRTLTKQNLAPLLATIPRAPPKRRPPLPPPSELKFQDAYGPWTSRGFPHVS